MMSSLHHYETKKAIIKILNEAQQKKKKCENHRVMKRDYNLVKVDNCMPCTTDLEGSKTKDFRDPRLGKSIKSSPQTKLPKAVARAL